MTKRIPSTKQTENRGLIAVATFANERGWLWRPTPNDDVGLDGELEPVEDNEPTGKIIKVQVKSGVSYFKNETNEGFTFYARAADLRYWSSVNLPVLLVVHHPTFQTTYGRFVHDVLTCDPEVRKTCQIRFDKEGDLLSAAREAALVACAKREDSTGRRFLKPGGSHHEILHSNLLPAHRQPRSVFGAPTECRTQEDIYHALGTRKKTPAIASEGMLWTFANLFDDTCSLRAISDASNIREIPTHAWSVEPDGRTRLVQLMNATLRKMLAAKGVQFDRNHSRYHLTPSKDGVRTESWQSLKKRNTKPVVYPHAVRETGEIDYWVHWAARFRFLYFGQGLYLMVEPSMVFTRDGVHPVGGAEMGSLSTIRKSHQYNRNVLGYLVFWRELLRGDKESISLFGGPSAKTQRLEFLGEYVSGTANFGVAGDSISFRTLSEDIDEVDLSLETDCDDLSYLTSDEDDDEIERWDK